jgi:hypothetical protein
LYLDRPEFEAQQDNAFMVFNELGRWAMDARWQGATHHIELDSKLDYTGDEPVSAEPEVSMTILLRGIAKSIPHIPVIYKE